MANFLRMHLSKYLTQLGMPSRNGHQSPVSGRETAVRKKWWILSIAMNTRVKRPISISIRSHSNK